MGWGELGGGEGLRGFKQTLSRAGQSRGHGGISSCCKKQRERERERERESSKEICNSLISAEFVDRATANGV